MLRNQSLTLYIQHDFSGQG